MERTAVDLIIHDEEGNTIKVECWSLVDQLFAQGFTLFGLSISEIRKMINYAEAHGYYAQDKK